MKFQNPVIYLILSWLGFPRVSSNNLLRRVKVTKTFIINKITLFKIVFCDS